MFDTLENVLPFNRGIVDMYLGSEAFCRIDLLLQSITPYRCKDDSDLTEKIRPYVLQEEDRIRCNPEAVAYEIDAPNTLALITGPGGLRG